MMSQWRPRYEVSMLPLYTNVRTKPRLKTPPSPFFPIAVDTSVLMCTEAQGGGFWSYIAGTAYRLLVSHVIPCGIAIDNYRTTLPMGKGLSSSAAVCVMVGDAGRQLPPPPFPHLSVGECRFFILLRSLDWGASGPSAYRLPPFVSFCPSADSSSLQSAV